MALELNRGRLYHCNRDAVVKAAVDNIVVATTIQSWLNALINLRVIKETDPIAPKIEEDLIPRRTANAIYKVSGANPSVKTVQELVGRTISFFNKLGNQFSQVKTPEAEIYADDKAQLDTLNFNKNPIGRMKLVQALFGTVETEVTEQPLEAAAVDATPAETIQPIKKFVVGKFKTIRDLKLFMLAYYHTLHKRAEEKSESRPYDSGQFLFREALLKALLKEYGGLLPNYKQYLELSAEEQAKIDAQVKEKLGFNDFQEFNRIFWATTNIRAQHTEAAYKLLGISEAQRPIIRQVKGRDLAIKDLEAEYQAWSARIESKYKDEDSIEKYLADNDPLELSYAGSATISSPAGTQRRVISETPLDERDPRIPGHVWPRLANTARRLAFARGLQEQLPKITAKIKATAHPQEVLIRFYLLVMKECGGQSENKALKAIQDLNTDKIFAEINQYLSSNTAARKPGIHKLLHVGKDINRQAKQLDIILDYIRELATKANDVTTFVDHLTNKTRLLEIYHKILDNADYSTRNILPWDREGYTSI